MPISARHVSLSILRKKISGDDLIFQIENPRVFPQLSFKISGARSFYFQFLSFSGKYHHALKFRDGAYENLQLLSNYS